MHRVVLHGCGWPILLDGSDIYVGGSFTTFAGFPANSIVRWDGVQWNPLSSGVSGTNVGVQSIVKYGGQIVAGGGFTSPVVVAATNLARWDGANWFPLGNPNNTLQHLFSDGTSLYVGGSFTQIGSVAATRIARWDGANWFALGTGLNGTPLQHGAECFGRIAGVRTIWPRRKRGASRTSLDGMAAVGQLSPPTRQRMNRALALCVPSMFSGTDVTPRESSPVRAMRSPIAQPNGTVFPGALWAREITGPGTPQVLRHRSYRHRCLLWRDLYQRWQRDLEATSPNWTGSTWTALAGSVNSNVNALAVSGGELYVGGLFTLAGGVPVNRVANGPAPVG
jgi:hypothetical protein